MRLFTSGKLDHVKNIMHPEESTESHGDKMRKYYTLILMLTILALALTGCVKPEHGTLAGKVILVNDSANPDNDPTDFSGVTIALYELAVLDTTLARINRDHPQTGMQNTQTTEFDHRLAAPLVTTSSDASGSFSFTELNPGRYNLALWKEDWGIKYLYELEVSKGGTLDLGSQELYPAPILQGYVTQALTFRSDHSYFITSDASFMQQVTIEARARIYIEPGSQLKFYGNVSTPDFTDESNLWIMTSARQVYSATAQTMDVGSWFSAIALYGQQVALGAGLMRFAANPLSTMEADQSEISHMVLRDCTTAVAIVGGNTSLSHLLISGCSNRGITYNSDSGEVGVSILISHSILNNIHDRGISLVAEGSYDINNCYFNNNYKAIFPSFCSGSITHNNFNLSAYHIAYNGAQIVNDIHYNNFYESVNCIVPSGYHNHINNNNFYVAQEWYIYIRNPNPPYSMVYADVDATNNYWAVADIGAYLADAEDNPQYTDPPCPYYINYLPKRNNPVPGAGIQ